MDKDLSIQKSVLINSDRETVWESLTNPEKIKQYFFNIEVLSDWRAGSRIIFKGEHEGESFEDKGTIVRKDEESILQYDYWSAFSGLPDSPENYSMVTYMLEDENEHTKVTVTQEGFANEEAQEHADISWDKVLQNLKKVCEK